MLVRLDPATRTARRFQLPTEMPVSAAAAAVDGFEVGPHEVSSPPAVTPVAIDELAARYGWADSSWQKQLLTGSDAHTGHPDGRVTVREIDEYLARPDDLHFVSSGAMQQERAQLGDGSRGVVDFEEGWQQALAHVADGDANGELTRTELNAYLGQLKKAKADAPAQWLPDQKRAPLLSRVADYTHEADLLTPEGVDRTSGLFTRDYFRVSSNLSKRVPRWTTYELSAADIAENVKPKRTDNFRADPLLGDASALPTDYAHSGFDRGHLKPARDSVDAPSMDESFFMSNIAPEVPVLNQQAWNLLEGATHELVQATRGTATIMTGVLFLDDAGRPLPEDQIKWIGPNGSARVALPTHFFKAVLVRMPDGTAKTFAYLVPNTDAIGAKRPEQVQFLNRCRVSVDELEQKLGVNLFASVEAGMQDEIEANATPSFMIAEPGRYTAAAAMWPQVARA